MELKSDIGVSLIQKESFMKSIKQTSQGSKSAESNLQTLQAQFGSGPISLAGSANAFYQRHLIFDNVIDRADATARERFEAFSRSVRDVLSQRWVSTAKTYDRENP